MNLKTLMDIPSWEWPENADTVIRKALTDKKADPADRLLAAEMAGEATVMNDKMADILLSILQNKNETNDIRCAAVISLGPALEYADTMEFDDEEDLMISEPAFEKIQQILRRLFMDSDVHEDVRRRILEASVRAPLEWHRDAVRAAYMSDNEDWRLTAVFCMSFIEGFENQILESLKNDDPDIFYEAVCAAGNMGLEKAWPHIIKIISSPDTDTPLLLAAIDAVVNIRPEEAHDVIGHLVDHEDEDVVDAACEALGIADAFLEDENDDDDDGDSGK
jgi:uncharacterized protein (UPF0147 family)